MTETDDEITEQQVADAQAEHADTEPAADQDTDPDGEPEPEPEPEQDTGIESSAHIEAIGKKLDNLNKYVARKMGEILGDDAQLFELCEICTFSQTPGWRPSGPLPSEVVTAVMHALGRHATSDYKPDTHSKACDDCGGLGSVATGSQVPGQDKLPCVECKGLGWLATDAERGGFSGASLNGPQPATPAETAGPQPDPSEYDTLTVAEMKARGGVVIPPYVQAA
jgi:hypothetical protein